MKIYGIFLKKDDKGVIEDLELIRNGFNIWAFIFQVFYLFYKKLWREFLIFALVLILLNALSYTFLPPYIIGIIEIGISIYIAYEYSDWKSKQLIKNGYEFLGHASGNDEKEAKLKFLENMNNSFAQENKMEQKIF